MLQPGCFFPPASEVRKKKQPNCKCKNNNKKTMVVQNFKYTLEFSLLLGHFHLRAQRWELTYSMRTIFSTVFGHFLYRAPDCLSLLVRPNFVSDRTGATTLTHLISTAISVVYEKHQTASETKASETKLIIVLCSVDCLLARIRAAQTNFSELRTGLLRKQCRFRVTAQCSENQ